MAIDFGTVGAANMELIGPFGEKPTVSFVSVNSATGQAIYSAQKVFGHADNGTWRWVTSTTAQVQDDASNKVQGGQEVANFDVNIPVPADTTPPIVTLNSITPTGITASGSQSLQLDVTYTDPA